MKWSLCRGEKGVPRGGGNAWEELLREGWGTEDAIEGGLDGGGSQGEDAVVEATGDSAKDGARTVQGAGERGLARGGFHQKDWHAVDDTGEGTIVIEGSGVDRFQTEAGEETKNIKIGASPEPIGMKV